MRNAIDHKRMLVRDGTKTAPKWQFRRTAGRDCARARAMTVKFRDLFGTSKTMRALQRAAEFGSDRDEVERRYRDARAAYIEASNDLSRFGIRYDELAADVPEAIDLAGYAGTEREPVKPRIVTADELDVER